MSSADLIRWGGLSAILAGVAFVVDGLLVFASAEAIWTDSVFTFAFLFVLMGMVGFHTLQGDSYGRIGRAGFYTSVSGKLVDKGKLQTNVWMMLLQRVHPTLRYSLCRYVRED